MAANKELWLCRTDRTNHAVIGKEDGGPWKTRCNLDWVANDGGWWSDANPARELCIPCQKAVERLFRKTHPGEHYVPEFMKASR